MSLAACHHFLELRFNFFRFFRPGAFQLPKLLDHPSQPPELSRELNSANLAKRVILLEVVVEHGHICSRRYLTESNCTYEIMHATA